MVMAFTTSQPYQNTTWLNASKYYDSSNRRRIEPSDIPVFACYAAIAVTGCICNSLTITVMVHNPALHTLYNFLLLNLAIGDLISSAFSIAKFIIIVCADQSDGLSDLSAILICRFFTTIIYFSIILSVLTLAAISLERYFGIVKPIVHRNMTTKRLKYFLVFTWVITIAGPALISGQMRMEKTRYHCFASSDAKDWPRWKSIVGWIGLTFAYIIPFIIITVVYLKIIIHMRHRNREPDLATGENSQSARLAQQKTTKTIRLLVIITVLFCVAILPELVYFAMIFSDRTYIDAVLFYKIGIPTVAINAVNPFIYTLSNPTFRSAAHRLIRRPRQRRVAPLPLTTRTTAYRQCDSEKSC